MANKGTNPFLSHQIDISAPHSKKDTLELIKLAQEGCTKSFDELVLSNLRYIRQRIKHIDGYGFVSADDLMTEGIVGIMKAIEKFDLPKATSTNCSFISYAKWWIDQRIRLYMDRNSSIIRVPTGTKAKYRHILRQYINHTAESPKNDMHSFLKENPEMTYRTVLKAIGMLSNFTLENDADGTIIDNLSYEEKDVRVLDDSMAIIHEFLNEFVGERNREIYLLYFSRNGEKDMTLDSVAKKYNMTRERVRQICTEISKKLRYELHSKGITSSELA